MNTAFGCESACTYCYIRYLTRWKGIGTNDIFRDIRVRTNAPQLLARELRNRHREWLWIGSTTDPYQPFEERYRLMRSCLEVLGEHGFPYEIITKAPLVARDVDLLASTADVGLVSMSLFSSLDDEKRRRIELKARPVAERIEALRTLNAAGVRTMALLLPIIPTFSDDLDEMRELLRAVRAAGTTRLYAGVMRLYPITWSGMRCMMAPRIHELRDGLQDLYYGTTHSMSAGAHVPARGYRRQLMADIAAIAIEEGFTQFLCEENFFDLWLGPQDEHGPFRYAVHFDFWQERCRLGGRPLRPADALRVARRFHHTPAYLRSIEENIDLLNQLTDLAQIAQVSHE
jgi:DNA repair photolyase